MRAGMRTALGPGPSWALVTLSQKPWDATAWVAWPYHPQPGTGTLSRALDTSRLLTPRGGARVR